MQKRTLWLALGALVFLGVLGVGAVAGGAISYLVFQARPAMAQAGIELDQEQGLVITHIEPDSPAAQAGLARGDILLSVNGQAVNEMPALLESLADLKPGDPVELEVQHGEELRTLTATLGDRASGPYLGISTGACPAMGANLSIITDGLGGAFIAEVEADSPAAQAGLEKGNVITAVDGQELSPELDLADVIANHRPGDQVTLTVQKPEEEESREVPVTLGQNPEDAEKAYLGIQYHPGGPMVHAFGGGEGFPFGHGPFDPELALPEMPEGVTQGVIVGQVAENSPAAQAGLEKGNIITALNGEAVEYPQAFKDAIAGLKPGDTIALEVYSKGTAEPSQLEITLTESPDEAGKAYLGITALGFIQVEKNVQPALPGQPEEDTLFELPIFKKAPWQPSV